MKVLVQRVIRAEVRVDGRPVGSIGSGLLILLGVEASDSEDWIAWYADKAAELRIFPDEDGRMNHDVEQAGGAVLVVSQFTLVADTRRGRRPSFARAAGPEQAATFYERFVLHLRQRGLVVETGVFQADMDVESINRGPVTLLLDPPKTARA